MLDGDTWEKALILGKESKGLYCLQQVIDSGDCQLNKGKQISIACFTNLEIWHFHLGRLSFEQMKYVDLIECNNLRHHGICQICPMAKMHRNIIPLSTTRVLNGFELLLVDIWGPYRRSTYNGSKFFLAIVDDHSITT